MTVSKHLTNEDKCYNNLAVVGIVGQACEDYLNAKKMIYLESKNEIPRDDKIQEAKRLISDCKRFFKSDWYKRLCAIPGEEMIEKLDAEFEVRKVNNFKRRNALYIMSQGRDE